MERRYGFSSKEAVGQVVDQLLKTVFPQAKNAIQMALADRDIWSGALLHHHADGKAMLTANYWQTYSSIDDRGEGVIEVHADIMPAGVTSGNLLIELLNSIEKELIESLTAISLYNSSSHPGFQPNMPSVQHKHLARTLAASQIARNAKAVYLLRDIISALGDTNGSEGRDKASQVSIAGQRPAAE